MRPRFAYTDEVEFNGQLVPGRWPGFSWLKSEPMMTIVVTTQEQGRPWILAERYLRSAGLWWVLAYYNNATDIGWPRAGDEVKIPMLSEVLAGE